MLRSIGTALLAALLTTGGVHAEQVSLLPRPVSDLPGSGSFAIAAATPVVADPKDKPAVEAAQRFTELLAQSGALALRQGAGGADAIRFVTDGKVAGAEAYKLAITPAGITVSASHAAGLFYGAVSLWELMTAGPGDGPVTLAARTIDDEPRFAWRGLLIDSARHFQTVDYIRHFIDWMSVLKLNVLHWHLTDDQGWRVEIKHYPKLTSVGAWRLDAGAAAAAGPYGGFYSQAEIRDIVAYAAARHITIVPEIDMPGHATAAVASYPEIGTTPVSAPSADWGQLTNLLNVEDSTFTFLETVLTELMELFPSAYIHVGGDEALKDEWRKSPAIQAKIKALHLKDEDALQSWFMARIGRFLEAHHRHLIGWDEILEGGIAPHATIMSWRGIDGALAAARQGHDTVLSPWPLLYLDNRQGGGPGEPPGRGHIVTVQDVYRFNPMPSELKRDQRKHVLGVQANLWTEHMRTESYLTRMAYPRAAALAEVGWTRADKMDWEDFSARLPIERARYARLGLEDDRPARPDDHHLYSQQMSACAEEKLAISVEDDWPLQGPRAIFLTDLENPCWVAKGVEIKPNATLLADVGQIPFNYQIGAARDAIRFKAPRTAEGELEVRADSCEGEPVLVLPLAPAAGHPGTTSLKAGLGALSGRHDLCFTFTQKSLDPLWVMNWIDFETSQEKP